MDFRGWGPPEVAILLAVAVLLAGSWIAFLGYVVLPHVHISWQ